MGERDNYYSLRKALLQWKMQGIRGQKGRQKQSEGSNLPKGCVPVLRPEGLAGLNADKEEGQGVPKGQTSIGVIFNLTIRDLQINYEIPFYTHQMVNVKVE